MKTKTMEMEAWIDYQDYGSWRTYRQVTSGARPTDTSVPCKITFEMMVEEPKVEITPSRIEEARDKWLRSDERGNGFPFASFLKRDLFGEDWVE